jgi:hypothetical protein
MTPRSLDGVAVGQTFRSRPWRTDHERLQCFRGLVTALIRRFNDFPGKVAAEILAEGQSEPGVLQEYRERYLHKRRAFAAQTSPRRCLGEVWPVTDSRR